MIRIPITLLTIMLIRNTIPPTPIPLPILPLLRNPLLLPQIHLPQPTHVDRLVFEIDFDPVFGQVEEGVFDAVGFVVDGDGFGMFYVARPGPAPFSEGDAVGFDG